LKLNYVYIIPIIIIFSLTAIVISTNIPSEPESDINSIVSLDKIVSGGPIKDDIPSIDNPIFLKPSEVDFISNSELVVGIKYNEITKAYPLLILVWHEIVNDWFGDTPLTITYCPLCYSSLSFIRKIDDEVVEFGTSGRLYKNDLVMYDRQLGKNDLVPIGSDLTNAGNLWSQMLGQAIVGELAGYKLIRIPTDVMQWGDWKKLHPDTLVLSTDTGFTRAYGSDPYSGYYRSSGTFFPVENEDDRLSKKEIIFGIELEENYKAYPIDIINQQNVVNDAFQDRSIVIFKVASSSPRAYESDFNGINLTFEFQEGRFIDVETRSKWNEYGEAVEGELLGAVMKRVSGHKAFWFAWVDFHPETEVYR
jgi:hypothetical protein